MKRLIKVLKFISMCQPLDLLNCNCSILFLEGIRLFTCVGLNSYILLVQLTKLTSVIDSSNDFLSIYLAVCYILSIYLTTSE